MKSGRLCKRDQIVSALMDEIARGRFVPMGPFPSEHMLMTRFDAARETIRLAVKDLEVRGLVYRRRGSGTFVSGWTSIARPRIGTLFPDASYCEIFPRMERTIARTAAHEGFDVVCADTTRLNKVADGRATVELAKGLISEGVRGVILKPVGFSGDGEVVNAEILSLFSDKSIPVVLVDSDAVRAPGRRGLDLIALDNFQAGCSLASHLIERRVRRIAFCSTTGIC